MITLLSLPKNGYNVISSTLSSSDLAGFLDECKKMYNIAETPFDCYAYISNMLKYPEGIQKPLTDNNFKLFQELLINKMKSPETITDDEIFNLILPVLKYFLKDVFLLNLYFAIDHPQVWDSATYRSSVFVDEERSFILDSNDAVRSRNNNYISKNLVFKPIIPGFLVKRLQGMQAESVSLPAELSGSTNLVYPVSDVIDDITRYIIHKGFEVDYYSIIAKITADFPMVNINFKDVYFSKLIDSASTTTVCWYWQRVMLLYLLVENNILIDFGGLDGFNIQDN